MKLPNLQFWRQRDHTTINLIPYIYFEKDSPCTAVAVAYFAKIVQCEREIVAIVQMIVLKWIFSRRFRHQQTTAK